MRLVPYGLAFLDRAHRTEDPASSRKAPLTAKDGKGSVRWNGRERSPHREGARGAREMFETIEKLTSLYVGAEWVEAGDRKAVRTYLKSIAFHSE